MNTSTTTRKLTYSALLCALLCVSAYISFPLPPFAVKFTMQTVIIFIIAILLEPKYSLLTVGMYIFIGLIGLPVFSAGGGISYILTPYFGYILGFALGAFVMSKLYHSEIIKNKILSFAISGLLALLIIYVFGVLYMYVILNVYLEKSISLKTAIMSGCIVFLPLDILKLVLAYFIVTPLKKVLNV